MATRIAFELLADKTTNKRYVMYDGPLEKDTLADLRAKTSVLAAADRFSNPDRDGMLELTEESVFTIEELFKPVVETPDAADISEEDDTEAEAKKPPAKGPEPKKPLSSKPNVIVVWTAEYISKRTAPALPDRATIQLKITRKPEGIGGKDKVHRILKSQLFSMKLDALRKILLDKGYIMPEDSFVDQGVPKPKDQEASIDVQDILIGKNNDLSIEVYSKAEATKSTTNDIWKQYVPDIKASNFKVDLQKPNLADYTFSADQTVKQQGFGSIDVPIKKNEAQVFSELAPATQQAILNKCRLYPRPGDLATCAALRVDNDIEFCAANIITAKAITLVESNTSREDRVSFSYSEELSKWQTYLVESSKLGASVPLTFDSSGEGGHTQTDQKFTKGSTIYLSKVLALPKAEVILEDVGVSKVFVDAVERAVSSDSGHELMRVLHKYGHFVATHFVIGGKVVATSKTVLSEECTRREVAWSFNAQTAAAFTAQGVPVELGGGGGAKGGESSENVTIKQHYDLMVRTIGGFGEGSSSQLDKLGGNWLTTIATQPTTWRVIGYKDDEIKPTLEYLAPDLRNKAKALLRKYFESQLVLRKAEARGGSGGKDWDEMSYAKIQNKISKCTMMYDQNIDSIRFTYMDRSTKKEMTANWHGDSREKEHPFAVAEGDEIVGIEVGWDKTVDHVLIFTRSGDNRGNVVGRSKGAKFKYTFSEPRIRGFHGRAGHFLDALGVYYYDLSLDLNGIHRSALLSLERYMYS